MSQHLILGNASLPSFLFLYFLELLWLIVLPDVITSLTLCLKEKISLLLVPSTTLKIGCPALNECISN